MALKRQEFFSDNYTTRIACNTVASLLLEALEEQSYRCLAACKSLNPEDGRATLSLSCRRMPHNDELEEALRYISYVTRLEVDVKEADKSETLYSARELLEAAARAARILVVKRLRPLLDAGVEHALLVAWNGYAAIIEGEERHVRFVGRYPSTAHTHPGSLCLPSHYDVEGFARLLSDGGCCALILSPLCLFIARRIAPLTLDDYDLLVSLARRLHRVRSLEEAMRLLSETNARLESARLEVYAL